MLTRNEDTEPSIDELVSKFYDIYRDTTRLKTVTDLCIKVVRDVAAIYAAGRRGKIFDVYQGLSQVFSDLCIVLGKCQELNRINRLPKVLSRDKKFSELIWSRYPMVCPYCANLPCVCSQARITIEQEKRQRPSARAVLGFHRRKTQRPRTLDEWVRLADSLYGDIIYSLTLQDLIGRLMEETIELLSTVSSVSKFEREEQKVHHTITDFGDDLADVFMWMCLVALKLESPSRNRFSATIKDFLDNTEKGVERIKDLQRPDFQATTLKGGVLEKVAEQILSIVPGFEVLKNKRTSTGEIDRVIRNKSNHPLLRALGTHILVECKSSKYPVSKKEVVDFIDKIKSHRCICGILVTLSGVSGRKDRDALGKIREAFVRSGVILMTFTLEDLKRIQMGEAPTQVFYEKYESVKFM